MQIHNMLANGMGGIDWSGLALAAVLHGVEDIELLIERLITIKTHRAPTGSQG